MRNAILTVLLFCLTLALSAQEVCSVYYPMEAGTKFQLTSYEKKDKVGAILNYEVKDAGSDWALLSYDIQDPKGKSMATSEYKIRCVDDGIAVDFRSLAGPGSMSAFQDMEVEITGTNLLIPNQLDIGKDLPDANMNMSIKGTPIAMNMSVSILNRKVAGNETITTPAGTFKCVVLTYDFESKMGVKVTGSAKQWLAEGVGMVRTEDYNKKGTLISWTELTEFSD